MPAPTRPPGPPRVSLALDGTPWGGQAGFFVARERGYYQDAGLDVYFHVTPNRQAALDALLAGRDDLAIVSGLELARRRSEGAPLVSLMAVSPRALAALIAKNGAQTRPAQMAGRKVAQPEDRALGLVVEAMVRNDGGTQPLQLVPGVADPFGALLGGTIDAFAGYSARESAALEARGGAPIVFGATSFGVPDYYELVLATTDATRAARTDQLRAFVAASARAYGEVGRDPHAGLETLYRADSELDRAVVQRTLDDLAPAWQGGLGQQESRWSDTLRWLGERGALKAPVEPRSVFAVDFVPAAPTPAPTGAVPTGTVAIGTVTPARR